MDKRNLAFGKTNYIILAVGLILVIIGMILMSGNGSDETHFNPEIFSTMRIKVAPVVCTIGFLSIVGAIMYKPKENDNTDVVPEENEVK